MCISGQSEYRGLQESFKKTEQIQSKGDPSDILPVSPPMQLWIQVAACLSVHQCSRGSK